MGQDNQGYQPACDTLRFKKAACTEDTSCTEDKSCLCNLAMRTQSVPTVL